MPVVLEIGPQVVDDGRLGGAAGTGAFQCLIHTVSICFLSALRTPSYV